LLFLGVNPNGRWVVLLSYVISFKVILVGKKGL